jgi:hypothetical protein
MKVQGVDQFTIGKTRVTIIVDGCVFCGSPTAESAIEADSLMFRMGDRKRRVQLKACLSCHRERYGNYVPSASNVGRATFPAAPQPR